MLGRKVRVVVSSRDAWSVQLMCKDMRIHIRVAQRMLHQYVAAGEDLWRNVGSRVLVISCSQTFVRSRLRVSSGSTPCRTICRKLRGLCLTDVHMCLKESEEFEREDG